MSALDLVRVGVFLAILIVVVGGTLLAIRRHERDAESSPRRTLTPDEQRERGREQAERHSRRRFDGMGYWS